MPYELFPALPDWFWYPITFLYGAIVGSFLNVVIYRLPLGLSVTRPPSRCPNCNNLLRPLDNVPLLGFVLLKGRCGFCAKPISWRYFSVELLTACLWTALYHRISEHTGVSWVDFVVQALFASVLVAMIFIDLDHFIAPDELNWVGIGLGIGRDLVCLGLAWYAGASMWGETASKFLYFGWLPRFIPGALAYGGVLYLVSMAGFVFYARGDNESLPSVLRRFFTLEELPEEELEPAAETDTEGETEEEDDAPPPRLRFSPGLLAVLSALLLSAVVGGWGILVIALPVSAFLVLGRRPGETAKAALARFFVPAEDDNYSAAPEETDLLPEGDATGEDLEWDDMTPAQRAAAMQADAAAFSREAESGKAGGMGLGDVKLALAVGAVLGPALALLSLMIAVFFGAATGITIARLRGRSLRYAVPFVPFMAVGAIIAMLYGPAILSWYGSLLVVDRNPPPPVTAPPHRVRRVPTP